MKHTEKGFIRFGYEVLETEIKFFVKDTGEGIPKWGYDCRDFQIESWLCLLRYSKPIQKA